MNDVSAKTMHWLISNEHLYVEEHGLNLESVLEGYEKLLEKPRKDWTISEWMRLPRLVAAMSGQDKLFIAITGYPETYDGRTRIRQVLERWVNA